MIGSINRGHTVVIDNIDLINNLYVTILCSAFLLGETAVVFVSSAFKMDCFVGTINSFTVQQTAE